MSRILMVWELGSGYGHVGRLLPLAHALAHAGHEPVLVVRDPSITADFVLGNPFRTFQAPVWLAAVRGLPPIANHTELLLRFGFHDASALTAMARTWRDLVAVLEPDLMLFDHAPTALLATRGLGIPRALFGDGFCSPPAVDPWPPVQWWLPASSGRFQETTDRVLNTANETLDRTGAPRLAKLSDLYDTDENFLLTFNEIDHYPKRPPQRFWGPIWQTGNGHPPLWSSDELPRVFAYLDPSAPYFEPIIAAFVSLHVDALVFAPGIAPRQRQRLSTKNTAIFAEPFDIDTIAKQCDAAVTQSGMGTACAVLLAGKPQILVPAYVERSMLARQIDALGAAIVVPPENPRADYRRALKQLLSEPRFARSASDYAARHANYDQRALIGEIVERCGELVGKPCPTHESLG